MKNIASSCAGIRSGSPQQMTARRENALTEPGGTNIRPIARAGEDKQTALRRLALLLPELQDKVVNQLPVEDILIWQQRNNRFHHLAGLADLREMALCRSPGPLVPRAALREGNDDQLLLPRRRRLQPRSNRPYGFSWDKQVYRRPETGFHPGIRFWGASQEEKDSEQLVFNPIHRFSWPGWMITEFGFSSDGHYITVAMVPQGSQRDFKRHLIFERDGQKNGQEWRQDCVFIDEQGADCTCFSADATSLAVTAKDSADILIWSRQMPDCWAETWAWKNTQRLAYENANGSQVSRMRFLPESSTVYSDGRLRVDPSWLTVHTSDGRLRIWDTDDWQQCATFCCDEFVVGPNSDWCSPDGTWLLLFSAADNKLALFSRNNENGLAGSAPVELGAGRIERQAVFHPCAFRTSLFVVLEDRSMVMVEPRGSVWQVRDSLYHPCGIGSVAFIRGGKQMLTWCQTSPGVVLWEETPRGELIPVHMLGRTATLGREPYSNRNETFVRFCPDGRWIMAGTGFDPSADGAVEMWVRRGETWVCHREPFTTWAASRLLAVTRDGEHLAAVAGNDVIFKERNQAVWTEKTRIHRPDFQNLSLSMNPSGSFLVAADFFGEKLEILRLEEVQLQARL